MRAGRPCNLGYGPQFKWYERNRPTKGNVFGGIGSRIGIKDAQAGRALLVKCFEGEGITQFRQVLSRAFKQLFNLKPKASRPNLGKLYVGARF